MVRPDTDSLSIGKRDLVLFLALPGQNTVFLADTADLPPVVDPRKVWAWYRVVQTPWHHKPPAMIVLSWHFTFIRDGLAAKGEGAGVDKNLSGAVGPTAVVN